MNDLLFEVSWEVCNKVGGIYAVLSTKAHTLKEQYNDNLIFIGPDLWKDGEESPFFKENKALLRTWKAKETLPCGISVRTGRWQVPGTPIAILVDFKGVSAMKDELYGKIWELYGVDSLHAYGDYDESCEFAVASAMVIESLTHFKKTKGDVIAHFDEWTTGMGLLYLKWKCPEIATVFTTHATSIGRSICGNGKPLYDYLKGYNGDQMAGELNMQSKHSLEKAAAQQADAFTTVSEVTARECEQLLERSPMVTPNAFEQEFVPKGQAATQARRKARKVLLNMAEKLTGKTLDKDTLIVATSGRCEFRNKGLDVFLDSMNTLRSEYAGKRDILALVLVPTWVKDARKDLQQNIAEDKVERLPEPIITHNLNNSDCDSVLGKMRWCGMENRESDKVNVIFVPSYLNGDDGILNMAYYDLLPGVDLTVFASYYEPWGYTPLESVAFGVPTITTDLAGFGQWSSMRLGGNADKSGVIVVHRTDSNYLDTVYEVAGLIEAVEKLSSVQKNNLNKAARATAHEASWERFMVYYKDAYREAIVKKNIRNNK
ncbi:MAG: glycogen/starch synthase [Muribaculaceae bacterium]|nr:glycogen/starch synthase [Muribaculaceae bacterium]